MRTVSVRVHYPVSNGNGKLVLRTELDWERDVEPDEATESMAVFRLATEEAFLYFKPALRSGTGSVRWSAGHDYLTVSGAGEPRDVYPYFDADERCSACELRSIGEGDDAHSYRVFYPPGYEENPIKRYPVLYMHDGQNLFFPDEAFGGQHWKIAETLDLLETMNLVDKVIVVGVYPNRREREYTKPGYEGYARFLADVLKPQLDATTRTLAGPETTAVMGSSLGGVASLFCAWERPDAFGMAACLSSTFGFRDDLADRVATEKTRPIRIYLDSGWPGDNFEVTRSMHALLARRGYAEGKDLMYLGFPEAMHSEAHWAMRCHIPFQFLFRKSYVLP